MLDTARDEIPNSSFIISEHFTQLWHNRSSFCPSTHRQKCRISPPKPHHYHHLPHRYSQIHTNLTFHGQTRLAPWLPAGHASCCGRARQSRHSSLPAEVQIKHTHTPRLLASEEKLKIVSVSWCVYQYHTCFQFKTYYILPLIILQRRPVKNFTIIHIQKVQQLMGL